MSSLELDPKTVASLLVWALSGVCAGDRVAVLYFIDKIYCRHCGEKYTGSCRCQTDLVSDYETDARDTLSEMAKEGLLR